MEHEYIWFRGGDVNSFRDIQPISHFWVVGLPHSKGPRGSGNLKFTIYALLVPKMHHIKFEKNWSSGYQRFKNTCAC
jgi:hypothetical protein